MLLKIKQHLGGDYTVEIERKSPTKPILAKYVTSELEWGKDPLGPLTQIEVTHEFYLYTPNGE